MAASFLLGCPCGNRVRVRPEENKKEVRCLSCHRYLRVPLLPQVTDDLITESLNSRISDSLMSKVLDGKFRLEMRIGEGAMGTVYRGEDIDLKQPVAIKILKFPPYFTPEARKIREQRFIAEARIASHVLHPNIATMRSLGKWEEDSYYMVMDFCPGRSLKSILARQITMPLPEALEITKQILAGLGAAHAKGIVHRDIKPGNIMVDRSGSSLQVRILDFGIAKVFSEEGGLSEQSLTQTGCVIGTTHYMAPEQILGEKLDGRTDLHAVGGLLYHLLGGVPPYMGNSQQKVLRALLFSPPYSLRTLRESNSQLSPLPQIIEAIIARALAKRPWMRFATAEQFAHALSYLERPSLHGYFLIAQMWLARLFWQTSLRLRFILLFLVIFLGCWTAYFGWLAPTWAHRKQMRAAQAAFAAKDFELARSCLEKAHVYRQTPASQSLLAQIYLARAQQEDAEKQHEMALYFLEKAQSLMENSPAFALLRQYFRQEALLQQWETLVTHRQYIQARALLKELKTLTLMGPSLAANRERWLNRAEGKP